MQGDQPRETDEPAKEGSRKGRKGKKDRSKKKKRDRSSKKGKGKKRESRKKRKQAEETPGEEEGFLRVSTKMPNYLAQELFRSTPLPALEHFTPAVYPAEEAPEHADLIPEMPTHEPESNLEDPSVVSMALPESRVEVDKSKSPQHPLPSPPSILHYHLLTFPDPRHLQPSHTNRHIPQTSMEHMGLCVDRSCLT